MTLTHELAGEPVGGQHTTAVQHVNLALLHALRQQGYEGRVAVTATTRLEQPALERAGADVVLLPHVDAAERAVEVVTGSLRASFDIQDADGAGAPNTTDERGEDLRPAGLGRDLDDEQKREGW